MARGRVPPSPGRMQMVMVSSPGAAPVVSSGASSSRAPAPKSSQLGTSFNMNMLLGLSVHSKPSLRELVDELGMHGLPSLRVVGNFNRIFSLWLLSKLDPVTMLLDVGDGDFVLVDEIAASRSIGVRLGGETIVLGTPDNKDGALADVHALLGTGMRRSNNIPVVKLKKLLMSCPDGPLTVEQKDRMSAAYTMVAGATFLYPTGSTHRVADELLPVVARPRELHKKNFARYVVDGLRDGARKVRECLAAGGDIILHGNLLTLQLLFLDRKVHGKDGERLLPTPRSDHYNDTNLKQLIKQHAPQFLEFLTCYEQGAPPIQVTPLACVRPASVEALPTRSSAVGGGENASAQMGTPVASIVGATGTTHVDLGQLQEHLLVAVKMMMETHVANLTACDLEYDARSQAVAEKMAVEKSTRRKRELEDALGVFSQVLKKRFSPSPPVLSSGSRCVHADRRVAQELAASSRVSARNIDEAGNNVAGGSQEGEPVVPDSNLSAPDLVHHLAFSRQPVQRAAVQDRLVPEVKPDVGGVARYTPIRNRRLQLPVIQEDHVPQPPPQGLGLMEPAPLQHLVFGFSPFELELEHARHDLTVALEFYEMVMGCTGDALDSIWFQHTNPMPLSLSGHKVKANFNVQNLMMYNGVEADVRCFNEKEIEMMEGSGGEPVWRCFMSPEVALTFASTHDPEGQKRVMSMYTTAILGYQLKKCRMIMAPLTLANAWCLYVFDMMRKRVNVLDPVFTLCDQEDFKAKHEPTIASMLHAIKTIGAALDDGWEMNCTEWEPRFNNAWHLPSTDADSANYMMYYAEHYEEDDLDVPIPVDGLAVFSKRRLYEVMAMRGNIAKRPGFMLTEEED